MSVLNSQSKIEGNQQVNYYQREVQPILRWSLLLRNEEKRRMAA